MNRNQLLHVVALRLRSGLSLGRRAIAGALCLGLVAGAANPAFAQEHVNLRGEGNQLASAVGYVDGQGEMIVCDDAMFHGGGAVAVLPAMIGAAGSDAAWLDLALGLQRGKLDAAAAVTAMASPLDHAAGAHNFAGIDSASDRHVLRVSVALGHLLTLRGLGDQAAAAALTAELRGAGAQEALAVLDPATRGAIAALLSDERAEMIGVHLGRAFTAGLRGVPTQERAHGYLVAGLWAGSATLVALRGGNETFRSVAEPVAQLLDKDAAAGSLDPKLARVLRQSAGELAKQAPDASLVRKHADRILDLARRADLR